MDRVIKSVETGSKGLEKILNEAGHAFDQIPLSNGERKPVIAILGETFMRDNPFCSAFLVDKLEELGAETIMAPFAEWLVYHRATLVRLWAQVRALLPGGRR